MRGLPDGVAKLLRDARAHVVRQSLTGRHEQDKIDAEEWLSRYKELTMKQYKVWDADNEEEHDAELVEALYHEDAAEKYAEEDVDGNTDGVYDDGCTLCVREVETGELRRIDVQVEMSPVYYAYERKVEETS